MKTQNPIIGRAKGSAGGMTFSKNYDKNVARAKALEVSNPKTTAQTTERSFFAEVMQVVSSVSDDQLRSLFGVKPKTKSRRNALTSQIAAAYSVDGTTKSVDFSKLQAIGNGKKVNTPIFHFIPGVGYEDQEVELKDFGENVTENTNIIYIIFDVVNNKIIIVNSKESLEIYPDLSAAGLYISMNSEYYGYATCSEDGENVYGKPFGTFKIKTRATDSTNNRGTRSLSSPTKQATAPQTVKPKIDVEQTKAETQPTEAPTSEEENPVTE